jgi:predicted transcriptional regulator of viral defense system
MKQAGLSDPLARLTGMGQVPDRCLRLLSRQYGVIANWQVEVAGISCRQMRDLVRSGRWQRLHFGVYASFTGEPSREAALWAAVLRTGPWSILSHETAAELDGLVDKGSKLIHVTVPEPQHRSPVAGLAIHRSSRAIGIRQQGRLPPRTMTEETVLDLAQAATSFDDVIALLSRACQRRLTTPFLIGETLGQRAKMRWRGEIELALRDVARGVHSPLEYRYVRDVERAHGLPTPDRQVQAQQGGRVIYRDARYREYEVAVELDGQASHPDERRWQDKHRDNAAAAAGIVTLRYGWADVTERSCETAREVASVLGSRGWPGRLGRCGPGCRV